MLSAAFFSGGKESVYALYKALKMGFNVKYLIHSHFNFPRPSPHTINMEVIRREAESIGIPLIEVALEKGVEFESLKKVLEGLNIKFLVTGDLYLINHYNWVEKLCKAVNIKCIEPLWIKDERRTWEILNEEVSVGIEAMICGVDTKKFDLKWLGKIMNKNIVGDFLNYCTLKGIDPCGEKGEYHTLVLNSPLHKTPIQILKYHVVNANSYAYIKVNEFK